MPNALTHFRIYEKAIEGIPKAGWGSKELLKEFSQRLKIGMGIEDGGKNKPSLKFVLESLAKSWMELEPALHRTRKGEKRGYARLASYGYLGSNGPDMFFVPPTILTKWWQGGPLATDTLSTLMHHNTVGAPVIYGLLKLKSDVDKPLADRPKDLWMYKLAYWLGHITHIAADITVHPFVNSRAGANKLLEKDQFKNFRSSGLSKLKRIWTLHNIVEQYQDRYVLENYYEKRKSSFRAMAFGSMAASHLRLRPEHRFIGETIDEFYGQDYAGKQSYTKGGCKYEYCRAWYWLDSKVRSHCSFRNYLKNVVPSDKQLPEKDKAFLVGPKKFDEHITAAAKLSEEMIKEAIRFLNGDAEAQGDTPRDQVYSVRKSFPLLYANFNIDAGLCFRFHECAETAGIGADKKIACRVPLRIELKTDKCLKEKPPDWDYSASPGLGGLVRQKSGRAAEVRLVYPYLGVDVITEGLKRGQEKPASRVYVASPDDGDQDTVGKKIREDEYEILQFSDIRSVSKEELAGSEDVSRFSVLVPSRAREDLSVIDAQIITLCDRMLVPTICAPNVWTRKGDSRFEISKVEKCKDPKPTEQLFLKFHFFRVYLIEVSDKPKPYTLYVPMLGSLESPREVPFEPGINNIAVVVGNKNKLKEVYLDLQKVWDANEDG